MNDSSENKPAQRQQATLTRQQEVAIDAEPQGQRQCCNCDWPVSRTADICENCGEWLLKGQCNFCYADIEEGQKYCSECGNPPTGVICPSCGSLSHFDFCPQCNRALTEQAEETIQWVQSSVEFQDLLKSTAPLLHEGKAEARPPAAELDRLKDYLSKLSPPKENKKSFVLNETGGNRIDENLKAVEQSRQNVQKEEARIELERQKEIKAKELLEEARKKTFPDNQEARRFFGALKILLPQVIRKQIPLGWRCNAYDCVHSEGPQDCADPSLGGTWLYETRTETTFVQVEI